MHAGQLHRCFTSKADISPAQRREAAMERRAEDAAEQARWGAPGRHVKVVVCTGPLLGFFDPADPQQREWALLIKFLLSRGHKLYIAHGAPIEVGHILARDPSLQSQWQHIVWGMWKWMRETPNVIYCEPGDDPDDLMYARQLQLAKLHPYLTIVERYVIALAEHLKTKSVLAGREKQVLAGFDSKVGLLEVFPYSIP